MLTWCLFSAEIHEGSALQGLRFPHLSAGRQRTQCVYLDWGRSRECCDQTAGISEIAVMPGMSQRQECLPSGPGLPAPETEPVLWGPSKRLRFRLLRVLFSTICSWNYLNSPPFPSFPHMNSALCVLQGAVCYDQSFCAGSHFHSD